jgi:predicted metal-dependent phosphoesterase TrpH
MKVADLHLHTVFSDGTYTPEELIRAAAAQGLSAIAIVDHDSVDGIEEACRYGSVHKVEIISGIELTVEYERAEVHILGYCIDYKDNNLIEKLRLLSKNRIERIHTITDKLKGLGVALEAKSVFEIAKLGTPGRLHIARAMVAKGFVGSTYEAFQKYIGDKGPAYVSGFKLSPAEGIKLIKDAGGVPVLAHPYSINRDEVIPEFVGYGLMGLEVYYPEHTQATINFYLGLADKYNLLVTGGSDCHGAAKPEIKLGLVKIPYELVEKLKEAKGKI